MDDFLVIGGGIAGVSAGARLAALGRVTLLEREEALAYHTSGRSAALFEQSYGKPSTVALNKASAAYHATAYGGVLSPRGLMLIGRADEAALFEEERIGMELNNITPAEAAAMVPLLDPNNFAFAAHGDNAQDIDTDRLIQNFAREIRANGQVVTKAEVTAITRLPNGWEVVASGQRYRARKLVNAAGSWVGQIAAMAGTTEIGFTPLKRSMARVEVPGGYDASKWPMIFGTGENWYAKPDAGLLLISPADETPSEPHDAWADDMDLAEGIARFQEFSTHEVTRMVANWAGLRTFAPDRQLVIGPDAGDSDFIWMAGQGGYGFQTAPAASQLLADLVAGRQSELDADIIAALSPARFA